MWGLLCRCRLVHMKLNQPSSDHCPVGAGGRRGARLGRDHRLLLWKLGVSQLVPQADSPQWRAFTNRLTTTWVIFGPSDEIKTQKRIFSKLFGFIFTSYILNPVFGVQIKVWNKRDSLYIKYGYKTILPLFVVQYKTQHNAMNGLKKILHKIRDWMIALSMKNHRFHLVWTKSTNRQTMIVILYTNTRLRKIPHVYEAATVRLLLPFPSPASEFESKNWLGQRTGTIVLYLSLSYHFPPAIYMGTFLNIDCYEEI